MKSAFVLIVALAAGLLSGCASAKYNRVPKGKVGGVVRIEWIGSEKFIYRPDSTLR